MNGFTLCSTAVALLACGSALAAQTPVELGSVTWLRDYPTAQKQAQAGKKPILILFQEVPG